MRISLRFLSVVATLVPCVALSRGEHSASMDPIVTTLPPNAEGARLLGRVPVAFVPNVGQWGHHASYVAKFGAMTVFLQDQGWMFTLVERGHDEPQARMGPKALPMREPMPPQGRGVAVRMSFVDAKPPELIAEQQLPGRHNYFLGNDPSKWRSDVPLYGSVCYRQIYAGVDVRVREQGGHLEYDLMLEPKAQLEPVEVAVEGIEQMHLDKEGALVMDTRLGPVRMPAPTTWEEGPSGERSSVPCRYVIRGANRFGFEVTGRRSGWALTVDPGLVYSTFLGGAGDDSAHALALDAQGAATVAGNTLSSDFPTTLGAFDTSCNGGTYGDVFVTRLSPTGSSLVYSTFLGGTGYDYALTMALDSQGVATVAGYTESTNFPTTAGAFDRSFNGGLYGGVYVGDAFVTRLSPTGSSLVYSTFLGGAGDDRATALALDAQGAATVAGITTSPNFPTTPGAFDTSLGGYGDAFVTQLSPTGSILVYSTYLGGTGTFGDYAFALALDAQGAATVAGFTGSTDFPTTPGAFDTSFNGGYGYLDAFVTRLSPTGSSLLYSTFLGGTGDDRAYAVTLDAQGAATVAGWTESTDFPTTPAAFNTSLNGGRDAFVTRLSPTGSSLLYSTFLGGVGDEFATALALDAQGAATVAGDTVSTDFPTTPGAFDTVHNGRSDAFVTHLDMLPAGVFVFGRSSPGCTGSLTISVTSMPHIGNAKFALTCGNARPFTLGVCALTAQRYSSPIPVLGGVELWVDPTLLYMPQMAVSNGLGASEVSLPVPSNPALTGGRLFAQFFWVGPTAPPPCPPFGWSASNALELVVQP